MKFDFVIGNPPYQKENDKNGKQTPVYDKFMDEAFKIAECVELITPARFLFNAGQTSKVWNEKMLNDEYFKVLEYEPNASNVFTNTEIKGGVAITIRNNKKKSGKIEIFTEFQELNGIIKKILSKNEQSLTDICVGAVPYKYAEVLKTDFPDYAKLAGESFDLRTNAFEKLHNKIFFSDSREKDDIKIFGLYNKQRTIMFVKEKYIKVASNFEGYKVFLSKANGSGTFGEVLSKPVIGLPCMGHTQSFISIGNFNTEYEAICLEKYIKNKFTRCMLGILKTTQDITPYKWKYVPLQDFSENSDIDWSKSVAEIDRQLYKKYGLSEEEINFIETNVKEME